MRITGSSRTDNKGTTLIEMVMSFVLIGMFLASAAVIMINCIQVFFNTSSVNTGSQVAEIVLNKTEMVLSDATEERVTVDIDFAEGLFSDFDIEKITYLPATMVSPSYPANVVRVALTLKSDLYGEYSAVRYIQCKKLETAPAITFKKY